MLYDFTSVYRPLSDRIDVNRNEVKCSRPYIFVCVYVSIYAAIWVAFYNCKFNWLIIYFTKRAKVQSVYIV